jgi:hypothetical protein
MSPAAIRWWVVFALCAAPLVVAGGPGSPKAVQNQFYSGKVVTLASIVEKTGGKLDADASPYWLALTTEEGKVYPLVKDDGARMFFQDSRLLNRPMRLTGRFLPGSQLLQVVEVHSYHAKKLHEVFYWCGVCSIKRFEKKRCDCCGGPMELREEPIE